MQLFHCPVVRCIAMRRLDIVIPRARYPRNIFVTRGCYEEDGPVEFQLYAITTPTLSVRQFTDVFIDNPLTLSLHT